MILIVSFSFIHYFCSKSHCIVNIKEIGVIIKKRRQYLKVKQQELADLADAEISEDSNCLNDAVPVKRKIVLLS